MHDAIPELWRLNYCNVLCIVNELRLGNGVSLIFRQAVEFPLKASDIHGLAATDANRTTNQPMNKF